MERTPELPRKGGSLVVPMHNSLDVHEHGVHTTRLFLAIGTQRWLSMGQQVVVHEDVGPLVYLRNGPGEPIGCQALELAGDVITAWMVTPQLLVNQCQCGTHATYSVHSLHPAGSTHSPTCASCPMLGAGFTRMKHITLRKARGQKSKWTCVRIERAEGCPRLPEEEMATKRSRTVGG